MPPLTSVFVRLLATAVAVCVLCSTGWAESPRHPVADGFSLDLSVDYDGSRFRTGGTHGGIEAEWKGDK